MPRFSLRSMLLLVTGIASGFGLWAHREAWAPGLTIRPDGYRLTEAKYSADGAEVRAYCDDGRVRLWDAGSLRLVRTIDAGAGAEADAEGIPAGHFPVTSADGTRILTSIAGHRPHVWDVLTGIRIAELREDPAPVTTACFSPTDERILALLTDGTARIWIRRRPERWWGYAWLMEFWFTLALGVGLVFSLWRDSRIMRA